MKLRLPRTLFVTTALAMVIAACSPTGGGNEPPPQPNPSPPTSEQAESYSNEPGEPKTFTGDGLEFSYRVVGGLAVFQGDMILGTAEELEAAQEQANRQTLDPQSVTKNGGATCRRVNVRLCPFRETRWPDGVLPYAIDESSYSSEEARVIEQMMQDAAEHYADTTGVKIVRRNAQDDYLWVTKPSDSGICGASYVGVRGGRQNFWLFPDADALGCTVHELGHALGAAHEQSREDRAEHVEIKYDNIQPERHDQFDRAPLRVFSDHGEYDVDSIMHYSKGAFSSTGSCSASRPENCSIVPLDPSIDIERLGQRSGLSVGDREAFCDIYGNPAEVFITGLRDGSSVAVGEPVDLGVLYRLRNVGRLPMELRLSSSLDGDLRTFQYPLVEELTLRGLSVGEHVLTLEALRGCPGTQTSLSVEVTQTEARLTIRSPTDGSSAARRRQSVSFSATAEGFAEAPVIRWESDIDGLIGESSDPLSRTTLSFGEHSITASTANPAGGALTDTVRITITNDAPTIDITQPTTTGPFCADELITFSAVVQDLNDEGNTLADEAVTWRVAGVTFGAGKTVTYGFVAGDYTVVARAADSEGAFAEDSVTLTVVSCEENTPPQVAITTPAADSGTSDDAYAYDGYDEARSQWFTNVTLAGTGSDAEDGTLSAEALVWTTNRGDLQTTALGRGNSLTVTLYSDTCTGVWHDITLTVTDSGGISRSVIRRIFIWSLC